MAYIGREPQIGNFQICDAISTVNDQAAYTMQVSSVDVLPESANHMIVSLNGVIQKPNSSYTVSGATITFASNLVTGDVINFIQILGSVLDLGVPSDDTVTAAKLSSNAVTTAKILDANVTTAKITDNAITLAKLASGTDGNIISYDASGNPVAVATGNDGQVLTSAGAGAPPAFETISTTPADNSITNAKLAAGAFAKITGTGTLADFTSTGIDDNGSVKVLEVSNANQVKIISNKASDLVFLLQNSGNSGPYGMAIDFTAAATDNNSTYFHKGADSSADRFYIWSDGDVVNHDNSYGSISDERAKSNIVNANSQWNDIKAVKVRNYKKNDDIEQYGNNAVTELGVIAQELEASNMSGLVKNEVLYVSTDQEVIDGNKNVGDIKTYKSVKYSILYMKAIKALQEAMTKIEDLETRVTTLENA